MGDFIKRACTVLCTLFFIVTSSSVVYATNVTGYTNITINVQSGEYDYLTNADITLLDSSTNSVKAQKSTDAAGSASVNFIAPGEYALRVEKDNTVYLIGNVNVSEGNVTFTPTTTADGFYVHSTVANADLHIELNTESSNADMVVDMGLAASAISSDTDSTYTPDSEDTGYTSDDSYSAFSSEAPSFNFSDTSVSYNDTSEDSLSSESPFDSDSTYSTTDSYLYDANSSETPITESSDDSVDTEVSTNSVESVDSPKTGDPEVAIGLSVWSMVFLLIGAYCVIDRKSKKA